MRRQLFKHINIQVSTAFYRSQVASVLRNREWCRKRTVNMVLREIQKKVWIEVWQPVVLSVSATLENNQAIREDNE